MMMVKSVMEMTVTSSSLSLAGVSWPPGVVVAGPPPDVVVSTPAVVVASPPGVVVVGAGPRVKGMHL